DGRHVAGTRLRIHGAPPARRHAPCRPGPTSVVVGHRVPREVPRQQGPGPQGTISPLHLDRQAHFRRRRQHTVCHRTSQPGVSSSRTKMGAHFMKKVIAAIDNSATARPVLAMAQAVASALAGALDALHVTEDGDETARASAEAAGAALRTLSGDPVEQLALAVTEEDVVALVLGARAGPGGPRPAGHLVLALAGRTDKPVFVVPPDAQPPKQLRRVLVAMEGSPGKARALQRTIELSTGAGLEIVVV